MHDNELNNETPALPEWRPRPGTAVARLLSLFEERPGEWLEMPMLSRRARLHLLCSPIKALRDHGFDIVNKRAMQPDGTQFSWYILHGRKPLPSPLAKPSVPALELPDVNHKAREQDKAEQGTD